MLRGVDGIGAAALDVCLHHYEKINGSGYPFNLKGKQISLMAKMGAVCDVYDAITSERPYKIDWEPGHSIKRMANNQGHFDDTVLEALHQERRNLPDRRLCADAVRQSRHSGRSASGIVAHAQGQSVFFGAYRHHDTD
jgi:HD-GYP domain-containing protein (c-di-GMP phosphodiesterase class II)